MECTIRMTVGIVGNASQTKSNLTKEGVLIAALDISVINGGGNCYRIASSIDSDEMQYISLIKVGETEFCSKE